MNVESNKYQNIFKATSLFGGVQVFNIVIGILKTKIVAILIGPTGVGLQGLYMSIIELVQNSTNFCLSQSAVREVSQAKATGDMHQIEKTVTTVRKLVWFTGMLGVVVAIVCSPLLSNYTFGSYSYIIPIIFLSSVMLMDQLAAGQRVVLQGLQKYRFIAISSVYGSILGLVFAIPVLYLWGIDGVLPIIIINSLTSLALSWYFANKVGIKSIKLKSFETIKNGRHILKLGIAMCISSIEASLIAYILKSFITTNGSIEIVGFYHAGFVLMNTYAGLVFNSMATDYYPRLAASNNDIIECNAITNQQGVVATLLLVPLLCIFIIYIPVIIRILYSDSFEPVCDYVIPASLGMLFRLKSWLLSYQIIAKGESRMYLISETIGKIFFLVSNLIGYCFWGLKGLGYAFLIGYVLYYIQVYFITCYSYGFRWNSEYYRIYIPLSVFLVICFLMTFFIKGLLLYILGGFVICLSAAFSLKKISNLINLKKYLRR